MKQPLRISITTGDVDGIGTEVTAKALAHIRPQKNTFFYMWRSSVCPETHLRLIDKYFTRITVSNWQEAFRVPLTNYKNLIDICSNSTPAHWVETTAQACMLKKIDGMVTGPITKHTILSAGMNDIGHTDILKRIAGENFAYMTFFGDRFNVLVATAHLPLKNVSQKLTEELVLNALVVAQKLKPTLNKKLQNLPLAVLGLNPHAGENELFGNEEAKIIFPAVEKANVMGVECVGPLVPDVAFQKDNWKKYSFFVCMYHDQGLIPFKMIHGKSTGLHLTAGLPFMRTSVDHGTAKDIFNKNKANPGSMIEAIRLCMRFCS